MPLSLALFSDHAYAQRKSHSLLTDTPQALLVKAPDEVSTQVAPCGLSVAAGLKVVSLSVLFSEIGVLGAAQDSDDARPAQQVWYLARTDPQALALSRRGGKQGVSRSSISSPNDIVSPQSLTSSIITEKKKNTYNTQVSSNDYPRLHFKQCDLSLSL
ncbi:Lipase [Dissostichus eleginoides]|uniref:Lipase n=1 Tax=Dissostichus eleginoides TaxID=100907 RepID=A0AAD9CM02_DISEL|nr:Lipase [Dissostichus eleginoides]